jgi:hypothetical protein
MGDINPHLCRDVSLVFFFGQSKTLKNKLNPSSSKCI